MHRFVPRQRHWGLRMCFRNIPIRCPAGRNSAWHLLAFLVKNPSLILADEPTGALDSKSSRMLLESFEQMNQELQATILMVTHDSFTASYAHRILFIKDGRLFNEIVRGNASRREFFNQIIDVVTLLGGDTADVL